MIPPLVIAAVLGTALYLLPVVAALCLPPRRDAARLLDAGAALALDAVAVLLLARFVPLGDAAWMSRGVWLLVAVAARLQRPHAPRVPAVAAALATASAAMVWMGFRRLSYQLVMWDRDWHIPLASALRAQRVPFENVFLPRAPLRYHFLGDVVAAMIQSLSHDRMNSALALSLAHDVYLALLAALVAGTCYLAAAESWRPSGLRGVARGVFGAAVGLIGAWATLFASPFVLTHAPLAELRTSMDSGPLCGHSYLPFPSIGYRPHVVVAAFFIAQVFAALVSGRGALAMLSAAAALSLSDEASHAILAAALGATALVVPGSVTRRWLPGLLVAVCFGALLPFVSAGLGGSLAIGGAASYVELVPMRHLKLFEEPVPLTDRENFERILRRDYLPQIGAAGFALVAALWTRRRRIVAAAIFYAVLAALSIWAALRVEVNHAADEGHRFVTASMVLAPVVCAWIIAAARGALLPRLALAAVLAASGYSGWLWRNAFIRHRFDAQTEPSERRWTGLYNPIELDCGPNAGPMRRGTPPIEYVERFAAYSWAGCQPVRLLGGASHWNLAVHGIRFTWAAAAGYEAEGEATVPRSVVCARSGREFGSEWVCDWALRNLACTPVGAFSRCELPTQRRQEFFDRLN